MTQSAGPTSGFGEWDEWRYRHEFFWGAATKWIVAILATAAVPYTAQAVRDAFGTWVIVFPVFACFLGTVGFMHLLAEHARALYLRWHVGYREEEGKFLRADAHSASHQWLRRPIAWRIAPYLFSVLAIGFLTLTGLNLVFSHFFVEKEAIGPLAPLWAGVTTVMGWLWTIAGIVIATALIVANMLPAKRKIEPELPN